MERGATLTELDSLDKEINSFKEGSLLETKLSSLVWICTSMRNASIVTVIDANNPAEILNSFGVCDSMTLCIASVPGASPSDYGNTKYIISDTQDSQVDTSNKENEGEANAADEANDADQEASMVRF